MGFYPESVLKSLKQPVSRCIKKKGGKQLGLITFATSEEGGQ